MDREEKRPSPGTLLHQEAREQRWMAQRRSGGVIGGSLCWKGLRWVRHGRWVGRARTSSPGQQLQGGQPQVTQGRPAHFPPEGVGWFLFNEHVFLGFVFKDLLIYLNCRVTKKKKKRGETVEKRDHFPAGFTPQMARKLGLGQLEAGSRGLIQVSHMDSRGASTELCNLGGYRSYRSSCILALTVT